MQFRYLFLLFTIFLIYNPLFSQTLEQARIKLDSLYAVQKEQQVKIMNLQESLLNTKQQIEKYEDIKNQFENKNNSIKIKANVVQEGGTLRDAPFATSNNIGTIKENETFYVTGYSQNLYFRVLYKGKTGYLNYSSIASNPEIDNILIEENTKNNSTIVRQVDFNDPKYKRLAKVYGKDITIRIMNKELWEGMSPGMVIESIGKPINKASSNSDKGKNEQWIYNDRTLSFINGELKDWSGK